LHTLALDMFCILWPWIAGAVPASY